MLLKVEAGDSLIVKADAAGIRNSCTIATVLEKENQASGFIKIFDAAGQEVEVFGGTYMKINASNFVAQDGADAIINSHRAHINQQHKELKIVIL